MSGSVVVVGSMNRDYVCRVPTLPRPGETLLGGELRLGAGGKGGNQAVAVARLGGRCAMVGCVGDDSDGTFLLAALVDEGIDVERVEVRSGVATGAAFVFVDDVGENSIVVAPGANATVGAAATVAALHAALRPGDVLVVQAEIPADAIAAAISLADEIGARAILNLAPFQPVGDDLLRTCDPLVVNQSEALALLGLEDSNDLSGTDLATRLADRARSVVVTLGADGAAVCVQGKAEHVAAEAVTVVDSTGAGDAFTGALATSLAEGSSLVAAARRGVLAGTYAVQRPGAQASYPSAADLFG